jgi:SAM-dependent methyltransferase
MTPGWVPDELAHAGPEHLSPEYIAGYDGKAQTDWAAEVEELRALGLGPTSTLVDLGTGTGGLVLAAAPHCRRAVAADISPGMLAHVRSQAARRGLGNVECVQAGFLSYMHVGEPADFVYSRNALHHLPDFWKGVALARIAAILRPGGVLRLHDLVFGFEPGEAVPAVEAWLAGAAPAPEVGFTRRELETHMREEFSTYTWVLEPMLEHAGFEIREKRGRRGAYAAYTCVRRAAPGARGSSCGDP